MVASVVSEDGEGIDEAAAIPDSRKSEQIKHEWSLSKDDDAGIDAGLDAVRESCNLLFSSLNLSGPSGGIAALPITGQSEMSASIDGSAMARNLGRLSRRDGGSDVGRESSTSRLFPLTIWHIISVFARCWLLLTDWKWMEKPPVLGRLYTEDFTRPLIPSSSNRRSLHHSTTHSDESKKGNE